MKITQYFVFILALFALHSAHAFEATGFQNPYGIAVDSKAGFIYISNVNGEMVAQDDNGFISRLRIDGTVDQLKFIDGSSKEITLDAPKGMAIVGTTLYVTDIDKLRAFDLAKAKHLFDVNFGDLPVKHFYDISTGPNDALYLADAPGNTIYRVDVPKLHEVTTFVSGDVLGEPRGICWYPARQSFLVAGWNSGQVTAFDESGKRRNVAAIILKTLDGIAADEAGSAYVGSSFLKSIYRIGANYAVNSYQTNIQSPAGIEFNKAGNELVVALFESGIVKSFPVSAGSPR